ncbi:MAG: LLM class flavin-dependent oxidoreductase, partial [Alphaproteobacteria bacterium]
MRLSFFMMPLHGLDRDYGQTLKEDREAVILADRLGFAEAFIGEHLTDKAETITNCLTFIATLVGDTKRIKLGSGTCNLAYTHPAILAAHAAMVDHLLEGRFIFGISPGALPSDAEVTGIL